MRSVHIIALHGREQDATLFENKTHKLLHDVQQLQAPTSAPEVTVEPPPPWSMLYLQAPFQLPKRSQTDEVVMRTWCGGSAGDGLTTGSTSTQAGPNRSGAGTSAAAVEEHVRRLVPAAYRTSVALVLAAMPPMPADIVHTNSPPPLVVLFAFSEGCVVAVYVAAVLEAIGAATSPSCASHGSAGLRLVLACPPPVELPAAAGGAVRVAAPTLAMIGRRDRIVPPRDSESLLAALMPTAERFYHDGTHLVPNNAAAVDCMRRFLAALAIPLAPILQARDETENGSTVELVQNEQQRSTVPAPVPAPARLGAEELAAVDEEMQCLEALYTTDEHPDHRPLLDVDAASTYRSMMVTKRLAESIMRALNPDVDPSQLPPPAACAALIEGRVAACVYVPLCPSDELLTAAGESVPQRIAKQVYNSGPVLTIRIALLTSYPEAGSAEGPGQSAPLVLPPVTVTIVSGVPEVAKTAPSVMHVLRDVCVEAAAASGCPQLVQCCMSCGDRLVEAIAAILREQLPENCMPGGPDVDEAPNGATLSPEERALLALWEQCGDDGPDERAATIYAARAGAASMLSAIPDWRQRLCGRRSTLNGHWDLCIGLVGKPSAGKSSLFAAASHTEAKIGAFPFTTIDPNISPATAWLPCPCSASTDTDPAAAGPCAAGAACVYDASVCRTARLRGVPVLLKDVAGLVKGAYCGAGKGNRFLNDLCTADVLVHVVDGAGATNDDGWSCPVGEGDPVGDVAWVRNEVHSWIFDNVSAAWQSIRRRPAKLRDMFSGYQASFWLVDAVLAAVGLRSPADVAAAVPKWAPADLHRFVACFMFVRFPMIIAVNKADIAPAAVAKVAARIQASHPLDVVVCLSAADEAAGGAARATYAPLCEAEGVPCGLAAVLHAAARFSRRIVLFPSTNLSQPSALPTAHLVRPGITIDAVKTSRLGIPPDRKIVRVEAVFLDYVDHDSSSDDGPVARGHTAYGFAGWYRVNAKPVVVNTTDELLRSCMIRILTNAKGSKQ